MAQLVHPVCLLCRQQAALSPPLSVPRRLGLSIRYGSQLRRRTPSRMELSNRVAEPSSKGSNFQGPKHKSRNSPFGGMNQVQFRGPGALTNRPSRSQLQRSSGGRTEKPRTVKSNDDTFHALKMQQALAKVPYALRNTVKARIQEIDSFTEFALLPVLADSIRSQALPGLEEITPTPIQRLAVPALLDSAQGIRAQRRNAFDSFLLAAETGSGKTLAYLLPIIDAVKREEVIEQKRADEQEELEQQTRLRNPTYVKAPEPGDPTVAPIARPRAIILLPSAELVDQVTSVLKAFSHTVKLRAAGVSASLTPTVIHNRLFSPKGVDILVTTPHLLESITTSDPNVLSQVRHLVIDEADSLLDRSFGSTTSTIIDKSSPSLKQLILCSATIPRALDMLLRSRFPDMRRLTTPNLHAIPRRVQLGVVDVAQEPYRGNKDLACANTIWTLGKASHSEGETTDTSRIRRILVFVNQREKTVEVTQYLQSKGIDAAALHRDISGKDRGEILTGFTSEKENEIRPSETASSSNDRTSRRAVANVKVLVTTDLGSRGIDTVAVRHVILYDVPHSTIDFIHRLGRTGRMGRRGRGIILVGKGDRRDVVREVRDGMFRGQALI